MTAWGEDVMTPVRTISRFPRRQRKATRRARLTDRSGLAL